MKSTTTVSFESPVGTDRRVPTWAAALVAGLSRDLPPVVTRDDIAERLTDEGSNRDPAVAVEELGRLGWLVALPVRGAWAFIPPGQDEVADPYLILRAWKARQPDAPFMLAGSSAAWHLGYLDRAPDRQTSIWLAPGARLPDGLRPHVTLVQIAWNADSVKLLGPTTRLLMGRRLDIVSWASGLPAFGPEALLVQLAVRPSSFLPWADLIAHLGQLVEDSDDDRLAGLLAGHTTSAWQRASYMLHVAGQPERGAQMLARRPKQSMPKIRFEHPAINRPNTDIWVPEYHLVDRLIAPLQLVLGKA